MTKTVILKALVGSRAHGLNTPESDYDYRGVYVVPTSEILSLGHAYKGASWQEGAIDETAYELGHFLHLCTKANPSVLEVLLASERQVDSPQAERMRGLLPFMYAPKDAFNAFAGYSTNQRKKLLDDHLGRRAKFGVAYIRTAYNLYMLLTTGTFSLYVDDGDVKEQLMSVRYEPEQWSNGAIVDAAEAWINKAKGVLPDVENKQDLEQVNQFLLDVRKEFF